MPLKEVLLPTVSNLPLGDSGAGEDKWWSELISATGARAQYAEALLVGPTPSSGPMLGSYDGRSKPCSLAASTRIR